MTASTRSNGDFHDHPLADRRLGGAGRVYEQHATMGPRLMSLFDLPNPPSRTYPCHRCFRNVSVVATNDPGRPYRMLCDGCQLPPTECTCAMERRVSAPA